MGAEAPHASAWARDTTSFCSRRMRSRAPLSVEFPLAMMTSVTEGSDNPEPAFVIREKGCPDRQGFNWGCPRAPVRPAGTRRWATRMATGPRARAAGFLEARAEDPAETLGVATDPAGLAAGPPPDLAATDQAGLEAGCPADLAGGLPGFAATSPADLAATNRAVPVARSLAGPQRAAQPGFCADVAGRRPGAAATTPGRPPRRNRPASELSGAPR